MVTIVIEKKHLIGFAAIVALALVFSSLADVNTYAPWHFLQQVAKGPHGAPDANRSIDENRDGIVDAAQNLSCGGGTCYVDGSLHVNNTLYVNGTLVFSDGTTQNSTNTSGAGGGGGAIIRNYQVHPGEQVFAGELVRLMNGKLAPDRSPIYTAYDPFFDPGCTFGIDGGIKDYATTNLSNSKFVVLYMRELGNCGAGIKYGLRVRAGAVSGTMIEYGDYFELDSNFNAPYFSLSITPISATRFALSYQSADYTLKIRICDLNGVTISCGNSNDLTDVRLGAIASHKPEELLVFGLRCVSGTCVSNWHYILNKGTVSGSTVSFDGWIDSGLGPITEHMKVIPISQDAFVFGGYKYYGGGFYGIGQIRPSLMVKNTYNLGSDLTSWSFGTLSPRQGFVSYTFYYPHTGTGSLPHLAPLNIDTASYTIQQGTTSTFPSSMLKGISPDRLVASFYGASWIMDLTAKTSLLVNASKSIGCNNQLVPEIIPVNGPDKAVLLCGDNSIINARIIQTGLFLGIAQSSGGSGDVVPVVIEGISNVHNNLELSKNYYYMWDKPGYYGDTGVANITTEVTKFEVGRAISSTELLVTNPPISWK